MNEIEKLEQLYKKEKIARKARRYHAVLLVKTGKTIKDVSKIVFADEDTVRMWVKRWDSQHHIEDKRRSGRPPILTEEEEEELCGVVDENNPQNQGYNFAIWDCVELQKYVKDKFNKNLSAEAIRKVLKRKGFSYRKADYLFTKRDEEKRQKFIQEVLDLFETKRQNTKIMFCDEITTKLHPKTGYVWTRNGKVLVETACSHKKIHTIGAIEPLIGEKVHANYDKNNGDSFIEFLGKLEEKDGKNIILILDNYPVHHSKKVGKFLKKSGRITLKFLPAYSPDLNPIERLWGYARKKYLNCKSVANITELKQAVEKGIENISATKVTEICNLKMLEKYRTI